MRTRFQLGGYRRQHLVRSVAAGLITAAVGLVLILPPLGVTFKRNYGLHWLATFERKPDWLATFERDYGLDWLFSRRGPRPRPPDITVVEINNGTGGELGRNGLLACPEPSIEQACENVLREPGAWPSRTVHARLIKRLINEEARGIVFDLHFDHPKPGDDDLEPIISDRVILVNLLEGGNKQTLSEGEVNRGSVPSETFNPPTKKLLERAKGVGPFVVTQPDPKTFEFWAFKSDMPTIPAVALQLKGLDVYKDWLAILSAADAPGLDRLLQASAYDVNSRCDSDMLWLNASGLEYLPARAQDVNSPCHMLRLMRTLRRMFQDTLFQQRMAQEIDRFYAAESDPTSRRQLITALTALYAGPDSYYINFYGPPGTIHTIAYQSLLSEDWIPRSGGLKNNMVFVGRSDREHFQVGKRKNDDADSDTFYTSFRKDGIDLSGVEIMATAYANLLSQQTLQPSDLSALVVLAFGFLIGALVYLLPSTVGVPVAFAATATYYVGLQWRFNVADLWLPLATPVLVQLPLALLIGLMGQYLLERRKERRLSHAIRYYLPGNIVQEVTETRVDPATLNRVVFGTCLATDMSDFITLAETKPPRELALFMNEYFDALAQVLKRHGVDVMEFRADMIMCAWVSPTKSLAICRKGLEAAIEVSEIVKQFAQRYGSRHFNPRVGLQDGEVYVGHTGGGGRFLYSIVGDTANTAARLESLNKHLGTQMLAAESVTQSADGLLLRPLGLFQLKGKTGPTSIVEILGRHDTAKPELQDLCARFAEALAAFQCKEWHRAMSLFAEITSKYDEDRTSHFYWSCSQQFAQGASVHIGPVCIQMSEK